VAMHHPERSKNVDEICLNIHALNWRLGLAMRYTNAYAVRALDWFKDSGLVKYLCLIQP
jgi:hypothetical protein